MSQIEGSPAGQFATSDIWNTIKSGLLIALAAAVTALIDYFTTLGQVSGAQPEGGAGLGPVANGTLFTVLSVGLNVLRKVLTNTRLQRVGVYLLAMLLVLSLGSVAIAGEVADGSSLQPQVSSLETRTSMRLIDTQYLSARVEPVALRSRSVHVERERGRGRLLLAPVRGAWHGTRAVGVGSYRAARFVLPPYRCR